MNEYLANAGQTYLPVKDNINIAFKPFEKPRRPDPLLEPLALQADYVGSGFVLSSQKQHFLSGITAEMLDWFWANMEKCYYLWAPGSHKRFNWVKSPVQFGMEQSVHMISESCGKGISVFGGEGVEIYRLPIIRFFPFTDCLSHAICEGIINSKGELVDSTIHMWEDVSGGINHITATVTNTKCSEPPSFIQKMMLEDPGLIITPVYMTDHEDYEASQWPVFLPTLYQLWAGHPDPSQSVICCLKVHKDAEGRIAYINSNGPVVRSGS